MSDRRIGYWESFLTSDEDVKEAASHECCKDRCLQYAGIPFVQDVRDEFAPKLRSAQNEYLSIILRNKVGKKYIVNGKNFCRIGLKKLFHTEGKRLAKIKASTDSGVKQFEKTDKGVPKASPKSELIISSINQYLLGCEALPNKDSFQAPLGFTRKMLFEYINSQFQEEEDKFNWS